MPADYRHATPLLVQRPAAFAARGVLCRYFGAMAVGNLAWKTIQLPLYTIWRTPRPTYLAISVLDGWTGDLMIGAITMLLGIIAAGRHWPFINGGRAMLVTLLCGVGYTMFSEWLNVDLRRSWAYSPAMPVLPIIGTGISPLLQWFIVPGIALLVAYRPYRSVAQARR